MNERERQVGAMQIQAMTRSERALGMVLTTVSFGLALVYVLAA
jgi:hypothetical protein